jgi:hypothetical protein
MIRASSAGVTITGTLTPGNIPILTASGIEDSGVALLSTLPANTVWGNNSSATSVPAALTVLNLAAATAAAPAYSFGTDTTSGLYLTSSGVVSMAAGGKLIMKFNTPGASSNSLEVSANNTPTIRAVGTNIPLQLAGAGTAGVDMMTAGAANYLWRYSAVGTVVNYFKSTGTASGAGNITIEAVGGDSNIDISLSPLGTGVLRFGTRTAIGAETVTGFITIKDSGGTTRKLAVVS